MTRPDPPPDALPDWTLDAVDAEKMKVLALLLGDPNPIHFDPAEARRLGVADAPVNQGPSTMAMLANCVLAAYPGGRLTRLRVRLRGVVVAGQAVRVHGSVVERVAEPDGQRLRCSLTLDADGRPALEGDAEVLVPH
ncbi:MAG: MaoC family dehydratase [Actinomycetota bacterium]|nr:MaoC family dehydratase [Actinomycetota bacterium]